MKLFTLHGNNEKFYYAQILNDKAPYYLDFVHISETRTKSLAIGDYCYLLRANRLNRISMYNSTPTFSQKAFGYLQELLIPQAEEIVELTFENRLFYIVQPKILMFTNSLNWKQISKETPKNVSFFREASDAYRAVVTQEFKDICDKHKLKGMCFELKYDSEATP